MLCEIKFKVECLISYIMIRLYKLRIVSYFETLTSQLDFKTEKLLSEEDEDDEQTASLINSKRAHLITEIKSIESYNLRILDSYNPDDILRLNSEKDEEKLNEILFRKFCFFIDKTDFPMINLAGKIDSTLGYLIVMDAYLAQDRLDRFKDLLKGSFDTLEIDNSNLFFDLKYESINYYTPKIEIKNDMAFRSSQSLVLKANTSSLFRLEHLKLTNLLIHQIKPEAMFLFRNVSQMIFIYYVRSDIREIMHTVRSFQRLNQNPACSIYLNITLNSMNHIDSSTFEDVTAIRTLDLSFNHTSSLDLSSSRNLSQLQNLFLFNNQIISLDPFAFNSLSNLQELHLNHNKINSIDPLGFNNLQQLKKLILSVNQIKRVDETTFCRLNKLEILWLDFNQIDRIDDRAFSQLANLEDLRLNNNQIESLNLNMFKELKKLKKLWLQGNQMDLDSETLSSELNIAELRL